jgi:hypothetical protein
LALALLLLAASCKTGALPPDAAPLDALDAATGDVAALSADGPLDAGPAFSCGDAQCAAAQYCVARLGGPRLRCFPGPEAGPCPPDTTDGCEDVVQARAGLRCQEIRNTAGECLDVPPSCASMSPCDCFCAGAPCTPSGRSLACNYP